MLNNSPAIRAVIYWVTVAVAVIAIALEPLPFSWASSMADSLEAVAAYLAPIAGITAVTNMTSGGDVRALDQPKP